MLFDYLDGVYCGDGWYDDAAQRGANAFDDYNTWVFAMHVLAWATVDGDSEPQRRDELLERVRAWMRHYPYFFAADGAYSEFGRSLAYKFARLGAPLWAYKLGCWDHPVGNAAAAGRATSALVRGSRARSVPTARCANR